MLKQSYVNGLVKCLLTTCDVCLLLSKGERSAWDLAHVHTVCVLKLSFIVYTDEGDLPQDVTTAI